MKYLLCLTYKDCTQEYNDIYQECDTLEQALNTINKYSGNYIPRLIYGEVIELKSLEVTTKYYEVKGN